VFARQDPDGTHGLRRLWKGAWRSPPNQDDIALLSDEVGCATSLRTTDPIRQSRRQRARRPGSPAPRCVPAASATRVSGTRAASSRSPAVDHIASLVRKYGGTPFSTPALAEIPEVDPAHIDELIHDWNSAPPNIFVFQTGVGTRALFAATDLLGQTDLLLQLLDSAQVVIRGPKPATVLHSRKVRIDCAASDPFTTHEVLAAMHGTPLRGKRVVVQRYGETNRNLQAELESEGAEIIEIVTYRWGLPEEHDAVAAADRRTWS
jgi:uroporphyrinogen-III synthase